MKLMRIGGVGRERPVVVADDVTYDLTSLTDDITGAWLADSGVDRVRDALDRGVLKRVESAGERIGPPVARPMAVVCIGQNYAAHAAESGDLPPEQPVIFLKHPNTIVGPYDNVRLPRGSKRMDWEVELAIVIGRRARYLEDTSEALSHVAGVTVSNDVSEREFQTDLSGGQWSKGKCCETFNPLGPWLRPMDEVPDIQDVRLRSWVNEEPRQDSRTSDMVFGVAEIVFHLSQFLVLEPGDVINTGTPQGVAISGRFPYLGHGDVMELEIDGLGRQRQTVVDDIDDIGGVRDR